MRPTGEKHLQKVPEGVFIFQGSISQRKDCHFLTDLERLP